MIYIVSYDLKTPGRDYESLYEAIKGYSGWWHYLESTWIIKSDMSATDIANALHKKMDSNDYLLIVDITNKDKDGWLPKKAWDWIRDNEK